MVIKTYKQLQTYKWKTATNDIDLFEFKVDPLGKIDYIPVVNELVEDLFMENSANEINKLNGFSEVEVIDMLTFYNEHI